MKVKDRTVFSIRPDGQLGCTMTLRVDAGRIEARDTTGAMLALAKFLPGEGWGIVRLLPYARPIGFESTKDAAIMRLRHVIGEML